MDSFEGPTPQAGVEGPHYQLIVDVWMCTLFQIPSFKTEMKESYFTEEVDGRGRTTPPLKVDFRITSYSKISPKTRNWTTISGILEEPHLH